MSTWVVGDRVAASHEIREGDAKVAARGDRGVVVRVDGSEQVRVKFDPVVVWVGQPRMVEGYRWAEVDESELTRIAEDPIAALKAAVGKGRARVLFSILTDRELARCTSEDQLHYRMNLLDQCLFGSRAKSRPGRFLVQKGFVSAEEVDLVIQAMMHDRKTMRRPWEAVSQKHQRILLASGTPDQAVNRVLRESEELGGRKANDVQRNQLRAISLWGRAERQLVRVSAASRDTLFRVAVERAAYGLHVCHWNHLSAPGGTLVQYGEGIMFRWEQLKAGFAKDTFSFGAPRGVFLGEHLEFMRWVLSVADDAWWEKGYSHVWQSVRTPYLQHRSVFEDSVAAEMRALHNEAAAAGASISRFQAAEAVLARPKFLLVHLTVNLIAALHNFHDDVVQRESKRNRKHRGRRGGRDRRGVKQINLDDSGLSAWATTWCRDEAEREIRQRGGGGGKNCDPVSPLHADEEE